MSDDVRWMAEALVLAARARPSPNPPVGAVVVRGGRVIYRINCYINNSR